MTMSAYARLEEIFERVSLLNNGQRTLTWDRRTMMPAGSGKTRDRVIATLRSIAEEMLTTSRVSDLLDAAEAEDAADLAPWQAANLREMRRIWRYHVIIPMSLQSAIAELAGVTESAWHAAKLRNDFASFVGPLRDYLTLQIEASRIRGEAWQLDPYDALLDEHDPGLRMATIDPLFDDLADSLPGLLHRIEQKQNGERVPLPLDGPFSKRRQTELSRGLARQVGFDFKRGRLDQSAHPYTTIVPDDIRITTRFREDDVREGVIATLHESGHAMYEAGLPPEWRFQPVGLARGGALHESQALLFEMQAGRSGPFLRHLARRLRQLFGKQGSAWSDGNMLALFRQVRAGTDRVRADEVTYPLHIILRYRVERRLIEGSLDVADLPEAWNAASQELLGVTPPTDALGCLQDPHWVIGYLGYFPVYGLGALIAAQCFAAAKRDEPQILAALEEGDFSPLLRWARLHVHQAGSFPVTGAEIVERATGAPLSTSAFKAHLVARYLGETTAA